MTDDLRERVADLAAGWLPGYYSRADRIALALAVAEHVLQQCLRHCQIEVIPDSYDVWEEGYNEGVKSCMSHLNALLKTIQT